MLYFKEDLKIEDVNEIRKNYNQNYIDKMKKTLIKKIEL